MREDEKLKQDLMVLDRETLADFITSIYCQNRYLTQQINRLRHFNHIPALIKEIDWQIEVLKGDNDTVHWQEASQFSAFLDKLIDDIEQVVMPKQPLEAVRLAERFLETAPQSLNRCLDDSFGVSEAYGRTCLLWLKAASHCSPPTGTWVD